MRQHPIGTGPFKFGAFKPNEYIKVTRNPDWEIERKLAEDDARPIIFYNRGASCWQPYVKGLTIMVNSITNGWRMEDVWLDK